MEGKEILKRYERAYQEKQVYMSHCQEVADLVIPTREFLRKTPAGSRRNFRIYDSTAPNAHARFTGGLHGLLINDAIMWFMLRLEDEALNQDESVQAWLQDCRNRMLAVYNNAKSGFYMAAHEVMQDLAAFGFGTMLGPTESKGGIVFKAVSMPGVLIDEDKDGAVDTVYEKFALSPRAAYQKFGDDLSERVRAMIDSPTAPNEVWFVQCVEPRESYDTEKLNGKNKPFASYTVEYDTGHMVTESGFDQLPYLCPRYEKAAGEKYGRGPAMQVLPSIKMINAMKRTVIVGANKMVDPAWLVPSDSFIGPPKLEPASINYIEAGMSEQIRPMETKGRPDLGESMIDREAAIIKEAFYYDALQSPPIDRQTAYEYGERQKERMQLLSPIMARLKAELLSPMTERLFAMMVKNRMFLPAPAHVRGMKMSIQYVGPLALAQQASELSGIKQTLDLIGPAAQADPSIMQAIDWDFLLRRIALLQGLDSKIVKSKVVLMRERAAQAQAAAQQQQMEQMQGMAKAAKDGGAAAQSAEQAPNTMKQIAGAIGGGKRVA